MKSTNAIEIMNDGIRRIKITSSFPNMDSAMKIFYYKLREYNSKHAFRKINEMFNERYSL